jgi:sarcosine oxidase subunit beta
MASCVLLWSQLRAPPAPTQSFQPVMALQRYVGLFRLPAARVLYAAVAIEGGLVFGGDLDFYASYASRGNLPMVEHVMEAGMTLMPMIGRARVLRSWGGIMDMTPDGSPIIDKTPVDGLFIDCGWNYGGFKAVPASGWCMAHLMATGQPHEVARRFRLDRFATGHLLDEEGTGSQHNLH